MTETVNTKEASVTKNLSRPPTFVPAVSSVLHLPLIPLQATSYTTVSLAGCRNNAIIVSLFMITTSIDHTRYSQ